MTQPQAEQATQSQQATQAKQTTQASQAHQTPQASLFLIAGHWLGAWAWDEVIAQPALAHARKIPLTLPGLDPADANRASRTIEDQANHIVQALQNPEAAAGSRIVAAHSGANAPVSLVLSSHPELIDRVVWVDSGPLSDGAVFAPNAPDNLVELPLPSFEDLGAQASLAGISTAALDRFRQRAVPEPGPVVREALRLRGVAGRSVPSTFICCSITGEQIRALAEADHPMFSEVAKLSDVEFVDLPTGHWPMWSEPEALAKILSERLD